MMISRSLFAAMLLASCALADPPLTTIQDVLYKADGARFAGTLTISWTSFEAIDQSAIASQVTTVTVTDGNLRVQLVPTTTAVPAANYTVKYNSDGRIQFSETWAVPSSMAPLRVRDVRVASTQALATGSAGADTGVTPVQESDVAGLVADLGARPLKGPGYAGGRVAVVNTTGSLESVTGSPSDCVRVDGSSGPCGSSAPSFVDGETPTGIVDGSNTTFTLSAVPDPASSLAVYRNGVRQQLGQDYNVSGASVQFVSAAAPQPGDTLLASYRTGETGGGSSSVPGNYVDPTGSYSNPAWITSLAYTKITGVPSFEPAIQAGTAGQYLRGDKSWQTLNAAAVPNAADITSSYSDPAWLTISKTKVGLGNVENTALSSWPGTSNLTTIGTLAAGTVPWVRLSGVPSSFAPASHAATHAAAGSDPITAAAIGAVPSSSKNQANGYVGLDASGNVSIGATVVDPVNGITTPAITMPTGTVFSASGAHIAASSVAAPAAGSSTLFYDTGNGDKLSRKDSTGTVNVVEGGSAPIHQYGGKLIPGTSPTEYITVPQACTINGWDIKVDAGTATVKFWKTATGTALPTASNSISTSGVSISTGTVVHSATVTDFTTTTIGAHDILAVTIAASSGAAWVQATLECQ